MKQEQLLSAILTNIAEGIFALDTELCITYINPSAARMSGSPENVILGKSASQALTLLESKNLSSFLQNLPVPGSPCIFSDAILKINGNTFIVDGSITALNDAIGEIQGYVIITRDISDMKKLHATLDHQASHDKLTGLVNREGFVVELDSILDLIKRSGGSHILIQININGFKKITGNWGVMGGNAIIIQFAEVLKSVARGEDILARLTNDIFAMISLESSPEYAAALSRRIHEAVAHTVFSYNDQTFQLSASIGIVQITRKAAFAEALMLAVDSACISARCSGGDKTLSV
jgi:diguanylate cyclase (GGDEF)-like protein/PAS domain S-box-containing protein